MRIKERLIKGIFYPVLLAGLSLIFFFDTLFLGNSFSFRDIYRYFYPYKKFAAEGLRSGVFPHWNSLNSCGTPFFAGLQSQVAYPVSVLYYILPFDFGFNLFIASHFFLAGLFVYFLCLEFGFKKYSAFFSAVLFTFSGYMISVVEMITTLSSVIWAPLILLVFKRALESKEMKARLVYTILTGVLLMVQFLGGEPTTLYITLGILALFSMFFYRKKPFLVFFGALAAALLFSSFQLLPFLEFLVNSDRNNQPEAITRILNSLWSFPPDGIFAFIIPSFFKEGSFSELFFGEKNQIWLKSAFIGLIPVVLALTSGIYVLKEKEERRRYLLFYIFLGLISLFLAAGRFNIFYEQLYSFLPGFKQIRFPIKFLFPVFLSIAFLAGFTLERIFETKKLQKKRLFRVVLLLSAGIAVTGIMMCLLRNNIVALLAKFVNPEGLCKYLYYADMNHTGAIDYFLTAIFIFLFGALIIGLYCKGKVKKEFAAGIIILIVSLELFINNEPVNQRISAEFYGRTQGVESYLKENQGASRTYILRPGEKEAWLQGETFYEAMYYAKNRLYPNQNMLSGVRVASGYDSILVRDYYDLLKYINNNKKRRYLDLISARFIVTEELLDKKAFPLKYSFDGVKIYENEGSLPRCFVAKELKGFNNEKQAREYIKSDSYDPNKETIIINPVDSGIHQGGGAGGEVKIEEETPNMVKISALLHKKSFVVLNDTYYPGWEVFVDKKIEKLYRANGIFRGLYCPSGKHEIVFKYNPKAFKTGLVLSLISILTVICILFELYFNKPRKKGMIHG
ncbi:MAG: YfhO family protein [Candidatus Firestonebacteria bacterium]